MQASSNVRRVVLYALSAWTMVLAGCGDRNDAAAVPLAPVKVFVMTVGSQPVDLNVDLPGRIEPIRTAEVRARVDGIVEKLLYTEGSDVEAGDPLFQIDPRLQGAAGAGQCHAAARAVRAEECALGHRAVPSAGAAPGGQRPGVRGGVGGAGPGAG